MKKIINFITGFLFGRYKLRIEKKMPKAQEEKIKFLCEQLVDIIDYMSKNDKEVKNFDVFYDYSHHKKREIHFTNNDTKFQYRWKYEKENPNFKGK